MKGKPEGEMKRWIGAAVVLAATAYAAGAAEDNIIRFSNPLTFSFDTWSLPDLTSWQLNFNWDLPVAQNTHPLRDGRSFDLKFGYGYNDNSLGQFTFTNNSGRPISNFSLCSSLYPTLTRSTSIYTITVAEDNWRVDSLDIGYFDGAFVRLEGSRLTRLPAPSAEAVAATPQERAANFPSAVRSLGSDLITGPDRYGLRLVSPAVEGGQFMKLMLSALPTTSCR
jgi:hypothetical protein